jgi:intein-encoded DNA endonuclease-like protein
MRKKQLKWSKDELVQLEKDYMSFLPKDIMCLKYNRNWESIRVKANSIGLNRGQPRTTKRYSLPYTKEEICTLYNNGLTIKEISQLCKCHHTSIWDILNKNKYIARKQTHLQRKYTINESYFDNIDTQEKAYILGFLFADGYNDEKKKSVHLTLQERDSEILTKINSLIGSNKPLRFIKKDIGQNAVSLNIENKHISEQLAKLGTVQRKSLILQFPNHLDKKLHRHFIRGYFDGDGSISRSGKSNYYFALEGNYDFLIVVQDILVNELSLNKTKFYQKHKERASSTSMRYCGRLQTKKILDWLYKDSTIYLNRKHNKYREFFYANGAIGIARKVVCESSITELLANRGVATTPSIVRYL